jgi:hypothetical protein
MHQPTNRQQAEEDQTMSQAQEGARQAGGAGGEGGGTVHGEHWLVLTRCALLLNVPSGHGTAVELLDPTGHT